ncbi:glycosyltransferase family 2 protein [Candidatus Woesebacteria bacterium]|nr:glycosyltransferase family 2 protein [Candidatus Woesebacteria bacterium]
MSNFHVSAICPIRDEQASILNIFESFKPLGGKTELIFVEGNSNDYSWYIAQKLHNHINQFGVHFRAYQQIGSGKASAVATGFDKARGKYVIIVDADMTVPQSELPKILKLFSQHGDQILASGNRLRGLPKPKSFYWINYLGNYFFRYYYSFILEAQIQDISCGSKAFTNISWQKLKKARLAEKSLDNWGDIDWLYYGKKIGLTPHFVQVDYVERLAGQSKLQNLVTRWRFALKMFTLGVYILKNRNWHEIR